jgi:hypothetical protein
VTEELDERELEAPASAGDLYLYRGEEVNDLRPVQTGDVFDGVEVPGLDDDPGLAIVLNHPCSMRSNGVDLVDRLLVARVTPYAYVPPQAWPRHHTRVMPLPELLGDDQHFAARFDQFGLIPSGSIHDLRRVACLQPYGVNLLQQRFIWNVARFVVETQKLNRACAVPFQEIDFLEEWSEGWVGAGLPAVGCAAAFHEWIRDTDALGITRQDRLADVQHWAPLRTAMREHLASLGGRG